MGIEVLGTIQNYMKILFKFNTKQKIADHVHETQLLVPGSRLPSAATFVFA